jgi:hypothetical protein
LTELLSKPSVLLTAWFLMLVVTLLPSWSVLSELVEPRAVRVAPATANSKELTFIQAGIASGNGGNGRRATINLGIGHRLLVEDDMALLASMVLLFS